MEPDWFAGSQRYIRDMVYEIEIPKFPKEQENCGQLITESFQHLIFD